MHLHCSVKTEVLGLDDPRMERVIGNDPTWSRWQRGALPLCYTRRNFGEHRTLPRGITPSTFPCVLNPRQSFSPCYRAFNRGDRAPLASGKLAWNIFSFAVADPHWQHIRGYIQPRCCSFKKVCER